MNAPLSDTSYHHAEEVGSFHYVKKGAESEQPVGTSGWAAETMQESLGFLIRGVGRLYFFFF